MKKILFFIPTLGHGGAERVLVNLVNHMNLSHYDITVQTMFDVGIYQNQLKEGIRYIGGIKPYFRGNTVVFKLFSPKTLYNFYIKEDYDAIISYLEGPSARIVSGCKNPNTKLLSWIHCEQENIQLAAKSFRSNVEAIKCYDRFDKILCVSNTVREDFIKIFKVSVPVEVIYNTVEADKIVLGAREPIDGLIFDQNQINICSVGKLMKTKGYDRLIRVAKRLIDDGLPIHIYLVGVGEEQSTLERISRELSVEDRLTFIGFQKNPYKYVFASDLYVCSSWREGFSTAVTESLIVGTPVISTNCSGAVELLGENDEYGIVTDNTEEALYRGIKKMLTESGLLNHYRAKARERGMRFNTHETVTAVENLIEEVIAQ